MEQQSRLLIGVWGNGAWIRSGLVRLLTDCGWDGTDLGEDPVVGDRLDVDAVLLIFDTPATAASAAQLISRVSGPAIALTRQDNPDLATVALHAGAQSAIPLETEADVLTDAVRATLNGHSVVTPSTVQLLASHVVPTAGLSLSEIDWLTQLAAGATVAELAATSHHSERTLYRLLAQCYRRIGVTNRNDAVEYARQRGLISVPQTDAVR